MRQALLFALAAGCAIAPVGAKAAGPFDGSWSTTLTCDTAPDGARGYNWSFTSTIRNGRVEGQKGAPGTASSGHLSGAVRPDGSAALRMSGFTGKEEYSVARVAPMYPFHFTASGRFEGAHGSATRNELRACRLEFTKA